MPFRDILFNHKIILTILIEPQLIFENSESLNGENILTSTKIVEDEPTKLYSSQCRQLRLSKTAEKPEPIVVDIANQNSTDYVEQTERISELEKTFIEDATQTGRRVSFNDTGDEKEPSQLSRKNKHKVEFDDSTSESDEMGEEKNNKSKKAIEESSTESSDEESSCSTDESEKKDDKSEKKDDNNKNGK